MSLALLLEAISPENHESALLPLVRKEQKSGSRVLGYPDTLPRSGKQRCLTTQRQTGEYGRQNLA